MKILVGVPMITGAEHCKAMLESVIYHDDLDVLVINNDSEDDVNNVINSFIKDNYNITQIKNAKNEYVNPAWNKILEFFLKHSDYYDYLIIMNSDLIMQKDWVKICQNRWNKRPDEVFFPCIKQNLVDELNTEIESSLLYRENSPGIFMTFNRKQAELCFPIPEEIKIWYGDYWCHEILRKSGYKTLMPQNLQCMHAWSSSIQKVKDAYEIIEQDKINWIEVQKQIETRVKKYV